MASRSAIHDTIPRFEIRHFDKVRVIGEGGFGKVVLYKNKKATEKGQHQLVVMKHLRNGYLHQQDLQRLKQEARILWKLDCEFVISLKGLCFNDQEFCIVMQFAQNGSCFDFFRHLRSSIESEEERNKLWPLKIRIAWQVIQAMKFLHEQEPNKILHLDLKAAKVLLNEDYQAKVCDFGLAQMEVLSTLSRTIAAYQGEGPALDNCNVKGHLRGTISHIAPEHLADPNRRATEKSDSYSFGIFLWELLTNKIPYSDAMNPQVLMEAVKDPKVKLRPNCNEIPDGSPNLLIDMMSESWSHEPQQRPDFQVLDRMFESDYAVYEPQVDAAVQFVKSVQMSSPSSSTTCGSTTAASSVFIRRNAPALIRTSAAGHEQDWTSMHTLPDVNRSNMMTMDSVPEDSPPEYRFSSTSTVQQHHQQTANVKEKKGCTNKKCLLWTIPTLLLLLSGLAFLSIYLANHMSFCFLTRSCASQAPETTTELPRETCKIDKIDGGQLICNRVEFWQVEVGTTCNVTCDSGFQLVGTRSRECLEGGAWSRPTSTCVRRCPTDTVPFDITEMCNDGRLTGSQCTFKCEGKKQIQGPANRTCETDGQWSNLFPACECEGCYDSLNCSNHLTWSALYDQLVVEDDKMPVEVEYGERLITCESVAKIWFIRYECTCSDSQYNREQTCSFSKRQTACEHALATLLRYHISRNEYKAPCDIGRVPLAC